MVRPPLRYDHAKQSIGHGCARRADGRRCARRGATRADAVRRDTRPQPGALDSTAIAGSRPLFGRDRTIVETSSIMSADLHEHFGQLIADARMNGVTPPWSR
jgi:hypothetical protein